VREGEVLRGRGRVVKKGGMVVRKGMCFEGRGRVGEVVEELRGKGKDCDEGRV
jgi:hypothetical protein